MAAFLPQAQFQYPRNALLDVSPINNAIDTNRKHALLEAETTSNREHRNALLDIQHQQLGMQQERLGMERQKFDVEQEKSKLFKIGNVVAAIDGAPPDQQPAMYQRLRQAVPDFDADLRTNGIDPDNYHMASQALLRLAGQHGWKLEQQKAQADIGLKNAQADYYRTRGSTDGTGKVSLQPIYGVDAEGNPVVMQPSDSGRMVRSEMPEGVTVSRTPIRMDAGTHHVLLDPITRQQIGVIPKDLAGAEVDRAQGKAQGQANVDLPGVEATGRRIISQIEGVESHPRLDNVTGWQAWLPTFNPKNVDVEERIAQLGGAAFLQAFESLKGGGQITEIEGKKATDALARLTNLKQSDAGFRQALADFKREVRALSDIARRRAGGGAAPTQAPDTNNDPLGIR